MCVLLGIFREFPVDPYYEPLAWFMILANDGLTCSFNCLIALEAKCHPSNGNTFIAHFMTCTLNI